MYDVALGPLGMGTLSLPTGYQPDRRGVGICRVFQRGSGIWRVFSAKYIKFKSFAFSVLNNIAIYLDQFASVMVDTFVT